MTTAELGRRIASANESLKAARLDGNCAEILKRQRERDELLDEWTKAQPPLAQEMQ